MTTSQLQAVIQIRLAMWCISNSRLSPTSIRLNRSRPDTEKLSNYVPIVNLMSSYEISTTSRLWSDNRSTKEQPERDFHFLLRVTPLAELNEMVQYMYRHTLSKRCDSQWRPPISGKRQVGLSHLRLLIYCTSLPVEDRWHLCMAPNVSEENGTCLPGDVRDAERCTGRFSDMPVLPCCYAFLESFHRSRVCKLIVTQNVIRAAHAYGKTAIKPLCLTLLYNQCALA